MSDSLNKLTTINRPKPYWLLRQAVRNALIGLTPTVIDEYVLMATILKRSFGNAELCACDSLFKMMRNQIQKDYPDTWLEFAKIVTIDGGALKGRIANFRFQKERYMQGASMSTMLGVSPAYALLFSCDLGLGVLPAEYILQGVKPGDWLLYLAQYMRSPDMQIRDLQMKMNVCNPIISGTLTPGVAIFLQKCGAKNHWDLAEKILSLRDELWLMYEPSTET
jgi:hypothetical protein